jgi:hypothetical protein
MRAMVATRRQGEVTGIDPRHVIVIGAARSGTKLLRDVLAEATGAGKVPYDIGYVWRYRNESRKDDVLDVGAMDEKVKHFIRGFVDGYASGQPLAVIEKTVGNALRVPAVAAVFPNARYVHLIRDGVDVIESMRRQWTAPTNARYLAAKVRHMPVGLMPRYGTKYVRSLMTRHARGDGRVGTWGSRYSGIDIDLREHDLLTVCARQWKYSVMQARADFQCHALAVAEVRYEALVEEPRSELRRLAKHVGLNISETGLEAASRNVVGGRQGTGRQALDTVELATVYRETSGLLDALGYEHSELTI